MASFSLYSLRRDACNMNHVWALSLDGVQVFCFIGWMQHTRPDMMSLNSYGSKEQMSLARVLAGFDPDKRLRTAAMMQARFAANFRTQQTIARAMMPLHLTAEKRAYVLQLQQNAAVSAHSQRVQRERAHESADCGLDAVEHAYLSLYDQDNARLQFQRIAGVRGFFDTPCMDDAHAVECEPSKIEAAKPEPMADKRASYREKAFNAYGRYAVYCARAGVAPYPFADWFADVYSGHEDDPAANWN